MPFLSIENHLAILQKEDFYKMEFLGILQKNGRPPLCAEIRCFFRDAEDVIPYKKIIVFRRGDSRIARLYNR